MEVINAEDSSKPQSSLSIKHCDNPLLISCNWQISNNKQLNDAVATSPMQHMSRRINCEDVASEDTSIALQPMGSGTVSTTDPCMLNIKVSNCQRIARIAVVSEGNVLEIFKQFGEYETTILAEFIDEYEENVVFIGETMIHPPSTEVSIKFIRTKNKGPPMWIYGIRLFLTESAEQAKFSAFDYDIIRTFLSNTSNGKMSQGSEMVKKVFGVYDKQKITKNNRGEFSETYASGSRYDKSTNEIGNSNEGEFPNCGNNYEQSGDVKCKSRVIKNGTECLNCKENCNKADIDDETCVENNIKSTKKEKSSIFNYKDFIQTFLNNASNEKMNQELDVTNMFGLYDQFDNNKITNNEQFYQKVLKAFTSDTDFLKYKNEITKENKERNCQSCTANDKKLDSYEHKNGNVQRNGNEEYTNCEDYQKSDINLKIYIDNKFHDLEKRLMERIDKIEANTNRKLDAILERLG
ncbi:hypothetical protein PUN28_006003 [Cardiocondyla obscurior]|uniref:Uncharacterized protein n=1 Tax=Cardiocondyla obscurior TaxID=286306 RepID=A0AAW2G6J6_9HYME